MKSLLVTGGTGSFGRAFVRDVLARGTYSRIVVYSRDEYKQSRMRAALDRDDVLRFFLGDVRDGERLRHALRGVDTVVHAAALKQVPALEYNPTEAVRTNIAGAVNLVRAAIDAGVDRVLALSTDKACGPVNLYGATKLVMEKVMVSANALAGPDGPDFSCTRYGNVAGSRGSVIEHWQQLAAEGKRLPLTHPDMTRFWMPMAGALSLVHTALSRMNGGEVYVPKAPSFRVADLARALGGETKIIGVRPGEKLHESLIGPDEGRDAYDLDDVYALIRPDTVDLAVPVPRDGMPLPDGFSYTSDGNEAWLGVEDLREALEGMERKRAV